MNFIIIYGTFKAGADTAQKMKFSITNFFSKCDRMYAQS